MRVHVFRSEQWVPRGLDETFAFFADARNLEAITPPFLRFRILTPGPIEMREGTLIDYALRLHGVPLRWRTRIDAWRPGQSFTDRQVRGPYARWVHLHTFEPARGGTWVRDRVEYALPLDPLSRPVHALLVRPDVERIFAYRRDVIARTLGAASARRPGGAAPAAAPAARP
uniref:CDP-paratose 2-epimerase n=1 Tax=Eiseniibacteriota bacterium TaxID=2212470 RepID=A0A832MII4_UNCEI